MPQLENLPGKNINRRKFIARAGISFACVGSVITAGDGMRRAHNTYQDEDSQPSDYSLPTAEIIFPIAIAPLVAKIAAFQGGIMIAKKLVHKPDHLGPENEPNDIDKHTQ